MHFMKRDHLMILVAVLLVAFAIYIQKRHRAAALIPPPPAPITPSEFVKDVTAPVSDAMKLHPAVEVADPEASPPPPAPPPPAAPSS